MGGVWKPIGHFSVINYNGVDCLEKRHFWPDVTAANHPAKVPAVEGGQGAVGHTRIPRSMSAPRVLLPCLYKTTQCRCASNKLLYLWARGRAVQHFVHPAQLAKL